MLVYQKRKDYNQALIDFSKAIEVDPNDATFYEYRGDCYDEVTINLIQGYFRGLTFTRWDKWI